MVLKNMSYALVSYMPHADHPCHIISRFEAPDMLLVGSLAVICFYSLYDMAAQIVEAADGQVACQLPTVEGLDSTWIIS